MSDLLIFILGTIVTGFAVAAALLIGIGEGRDPSQSGQRVADRLAGLNNDGNSSAPRDARARSTS